MKVFLTGASGILGSDIAGQLEGAGEIVLRFNSTDIVLSSYPDVAEKMQDFKPDVVVHCAAMTNVDLCEDDKEAAILINVTGTENVARAAKAAGAKVVYISSCGVYGSGKTDPFIESDETHPQTYHHYTKLLGEEKVKEQSADYLIIRPGWLFGGTVLHRKNFVEARRKEAGRSPVMSSAIDKVGSPTYTADLARQVILLIKRNITGTYNVVNSGCASRFSYVSEIVKLFDTATIVEPVNSNAFPRKANMPDNECLENRNLDLIGANIMRPWQEALKAYITITYFQ